MSHSPEPWTTTNEGDVMGQANRLVSSDDTGVGRTITEADARRIAACVNACAGIPTEELERRGQKAGDTSIAYEMLRIASDFYAGGGLAAIPHGARVKPQITVEIGSTYFLGESLQPFDSQRYIWEAEQILQYHGYVITPPEKL